MTLRSLHTSQLKPKQDINIYAGLREGEAKRNVTYEDIEDFLCIYYNDFIKGS